VRLILYLRGIPHIIPGGGGFALWVKHARKWYDSGLKAAPSWRFAAQLAERDIAFCEGGAASGRGEASLE